MCDLFLFLSRETRSVSLEAAEDIFAKTVSHKVKMNYYTIQLNVKSTQNWAAEKNVDASSQIILLSMYIETLKLVAAE